MKEPIVNLLIILLRNNGIRVNELELEFQPLSLPPYQSLYYITGVLEPFDIENYALDIPKSIDPLDYLPNSFLAVVKPNENDGFAMATRLSNGFLLSFDGKKRILSKVDLFRGLNGCL